MQKKVLAAGLQHHILIDSAGTHGIYPSSAPDRRAQEHASRRGYDLSRLRSRQIQKNDFHRFDLIFFMDGANAEWLKVACPADRLDKLRLLSDYCRNKPCSEIADPYYGGSSGFALVLDQIEDACDNLLSEIRDQNANSWPDVANAG